MRKGKSKIIVPGGGERSKGVEEERKSVNTAGTTDTTATTVTAATVRTKVEVEEGKKGTNNNAGGGNNVVDGNVNAIIDVDVEGIESDSDDEADLEGEHGPELYFTDPNQLLDILGDLEEQNLSLIQNSQETEESLDGIKSNIRVQKEKMKEETETLKRQIAILEISIQKEQERERELERKYATINASSGAGTEGGGHISEAERGERALDKRIAEVYKMCIGDEQSNISTRQMLTNIEICMEELLCFMERTPKEKLEAAENVKEQERKELVKREALEALTRVAEERRARERERANADIKPKKGKQLVYRFLCGQFVLFHLSVRWTRDALRAKMLALFHYPYILGSGSIGDDDLWNHHISAFSMPMMCV